MGEAEGEDLLPRAPLRDAVDPLPFCWLLFSLRFAFDVVAWVRLALARAALGAAGNVSLFPFSLPPLLCLLLLIFHIFSSSPRPYPPPTPLRFFLTHHSHSLPPHQATPPAPHPPPLLKNGIEARGVVLLLLPLHNPRPLPFPGLAPFLPSHIFPFLLVSPFSSSGDKRSVCVQAEWN